MAISWSPAWSYSLGAPQYAEAAFSADELDDMLAPIALYPDPLLAQILPAASFGDQIENAQQLLNGHVNEGLIEGQNWDVSVKAIAHYPRILNMMAQNPQWTASLGQAYVTQEQAVGQSIQNLRQQAISSGVLKSTPQMRVIVDSGIVRIIPAQAQRIYVPEYNPATIWGYPNIISTPAAPNGLIGFGAGLLIGSWLNRDWDWHGRGPYYHGWSGGGWVGASRRYVNTNRNYYVNNRFNNINVNRSVDTRNTRDFRERVHRDAISRAKPAPKPAAPAAVKNAPPAPSAAPSRAKPTPASPAPAQTQKAAPAPKPAPAPRAKPTPAPPAAAAKPTPAPPPPAQTQKAAPAPKPAPAPRAKPTPAPQSHPTPQKPQKEEHK